MGKFSPTKSNGDCEEIANLSTAYGRRRRNWIDATVMYLPVKLSMPHAAINTASRSDTLISVSELSNPASTQRLPSVFTG
jgi:hypothetical protein